MVVSKDSQYNLKQVCRHTLSKLTLQGSRETAKTKQEKEGTAFKKTKARSK